VNFLVLAQAEIVGYSPLIIATVLGALGLWLMVPASSHWRRVLGAIISLAGLGALGAFLAESPINDSASAVQVLFWLLTAATVVPAAGAITVQSPVYSAILFALSLIGTAGLFLLQGAQFLGVATIVVYAGAIVVTFLFVVMLAQPDGHATYDRIGWGKLSKTIAIVASMGLLTVLGVAFHDYFHGSGQSSTIKMRSRIAGVLDEMVSGDGKTTTKLRQLRRSGSKWLVSVHSTDESVTAQTMQTRLNQRLSLSSEQIAVTLVSEQGDIDHPQHVAQLGSRLFAQHLISIEVAGTLLLMALVGAVAIVLDNQKSEIGEPGGDDE